ncbi:MAG: hypothetical protein IJ960_07520 [Oscillospiraceae bacterium]|nr:hypothetical protein [Oscillospiraceae bacterium]
MNHPSLLFLLCCLALMLAGCAGAPSAPSAPRQPVTVPLPVTEPDDPETLSTEPTADVNYVVRVMPEQITLYPFTAEELDSALSQVEFLMDALSREEGVQAFETERIAYDPIMTDVHIRQQIANAPVSGWEEADYYSRRISFVVTYSATYDHTKSPLPDENHHKISVDLHREDENAPWEYRSHGVPVEEFFDRCLTPKELSALSADRTVLAGYLEQGQDYWLYLYNEATGDIRLEWFGRGTLIPEPVWDESKFQQGDPIVPQPGDTSLTYDPSRASAYPADRDCTDLELLEKWMAVEGVTWQDLEERSCTQLVLVVAQEDGISTITKCYQRQDGGTWISVDGLNDCSGWTGSGGVMHNRRRNTNTSPAGLWSLGLAFGNSPRPENLRIPWRDITPNSEWVCDENSVYFNTWQEKNDPTLEETWNDDVEHLEDYPTQYAYACVIRYNTQPYTIPSRGCAIFLHCSKGATGGCIGLPTEDMVQVLQWLTEGKHPHILITGKTCD